jgi:hypothetical protein
VTGSIPWWGAPLFTVVGGVVGGTITQAINIWNGRVRDKRLLAVDAKRLEREATIALITALDNQVSTIVTTGEVLLVTAASGLSHHLIGGQIPVVSDVKEVAVFFEEDVVAAFDRQVLA